MSTATERIFDKKEQDGSIYIKHREGMKGDSKTKQRQAQAQRVPSCLDAPEGSRLLSTREYDAVEYTLLKDCQRVWYDEPNPIPFAVWTSEISIERLGLKNAWQKCNELLG